MKFLLLLSVTCMMCAAEDSTYWNDVGGTQLEETLKRFENNEHAKNVIIFVGDGMGIPTITSTRIYKGQKTGRGESQVLSFEKFPNVGLSKTYAVNKQVTDSAAAGTALFTGVKTNNHMIGLDGTAVYNVCKSSDQDVKVNSIMKWAQDAGKDTGIVTTTRITHATPAACYAHISNRNWECDGTIPHQYRDCVKDIARQLVEDEPGSKMKVILGGGGNQMGLHGIIGTITDGCNRTDGKNLAQAWKNTRKNSAVVTSNKQLMDVDINKTDYLMGIFSPDHLYFAGEKWLKTQDQPSLINMTIQAVKMLNKNPNGFVLMVEGGLIDITHHQNLVKLALEETLEFEEAVAAATNLTSKDDTLIIVTADHSHTLTINGYPNRGNDILGLAGMDNVTFETLTYANGPGYKYHRNNDTKSSNLWQDLKNSSMDRNDTYYQHFSPVYLSAETHGGEDVAVYAQGPSSYVLSGVYEANYIAHAISYVASIGPHAKYKNNQSPIQQFISCSNSTNITSENGATSAEFTVNVLVYVIPFVLYLVCK